MKQNLHVKKSSFFRAAALCLAMSCTPLAAWALGVGEGMCVNGHYGQQIMLKVLTIDSSAGTATASVISNNYTGGVTIENQYSYTSLEMDSEGDFFYHTYTINVTAIDETAFQYNNNITSVVVQPAVAIPDKAFSSCENLESVSFENATSLGENAFMNCEKLKSVSWDNSEFTDIPLMAFIHCDSLTEITIPASVTKIRSDAFAKCTSLKKVTVKGTTPPTCNRYAFDKVDLSSCTLIVPEQSKALYETADVWNTFGKIETGLRSVTVDEAGRANGKYIEGGRIVIVKGGVKYNMLGQVIR